ncbi:hypothetical protein [Streptomyces zaomyceticus]|uniref:hypothetical protein n=1 Tax=Streptomyces zaomyceticus TaxID=68286 RepID=UPI0036C646E2
MEKGSADQITGAVDTNGRSDAELVHSRDRHVSSRHREQTAAHVVDGENGITDLGEGTVTEDSVDAERVGHGGDLLSGQYLREATDQQKAASE